MADLQVHWNRGFRKSHVLDAEKVHVELERLRTKNDGELRGRDMVEAAKSKRNPLHLGFTWDDAECGIKHRLREANNIVQAINVIRPEAPESGAVRAYEISRSMSTPKKRSYRAIEDIMQDEEARGELLNRALGELLAIRRRYSQLQELAIVFREVDNVLENLKP